MNARRFRIHLAIALGAVGQHAPERDDEQVVATLPQLTPVEMAIAPDSRLFV